MYVTVMVGKFVKQVVMEWCPPTTGPLLPPMTDSLLARGLGYKRYHHLRAKNKKGPKPR